MDAKATAINKAREKERLLRAVSKLQKANAELSNLVENAFKEGYRNRMTPGINTDQAWMSSGSRQILEGIW